MQGIFSFTVLFLVIVKCLSQEEYKRPIIPDVFQTEIEGTFEDGKDVVEIDADMYFDRTNNRAALFVKRGGDLSKIVYNFDTDESLSINDNNCEVGQIEGGIFQFTMDNGIKKLSSASEAFFFTKSELNGTSIKPDPRWIIPTDRYDAKISVPLYGQDDCDIQHFFSKTDDKLPICGDGDYCNSTLIAIAVQCKDGKGGLTLDHVYKFSRFLFEIQDESVFLPPPGIHCDMQNSREIPRFPSYFSFSFDIVEKMNEENAAVFKTHKEVWYDSEYKIIRVDESNNTGLLLSSRIFDLKAGVAFTIIASVPVCDFGPIKNTIKLDDITRLPKSFFYNDSETENAVYVGKRKVHGLDYDVWSRTWTAKDSDARVVEEVYFLEVVPYGEMSTGKIEAQPYSQISHVDMYMYEEDSETGEEELVLLKYFSINNYRSKPKELAAFDVYSCFTKNETIEFSMKVKGPPLVKDSLSYREVLELLYNKIVAATGVSVIRISELRGIFDGTELVEVRGSIIDNSEDLGWPKSKEPGMKKTFQLIKQAAAEKKLSVLFTGEKNKIQKLSVTSVEEFLPPSPGPSNTCYSGGSLAAASLILLLLGVTFGVAGYYVFLKKRRTAANVHVRMSEIDKEFQINST